MAAGSVTARSEPEEFAAELRALYEAAGRPTYAQLVHQAGKRQPPVKFTVQSLSDWLRGVSVPNKPDKVEFLATYLGALASERGHGVHGAGWWEDLHDRAQKAKRASRGGRPSTRVRTSAGAAPARPSGGSRRFFNHLLDYHIEKFAGRDGEVRAILDYIDRHDRGYLFVDGFSGYGKTSLLAVLVRQQPGYLYHFISQRYKTPGGSFDPTRLDDLLSNICEQLEPARDAPLGGHALTVRFLEAVAVDRDTPTVLVLDAIDEVDKHPSFLLGLLQKQLPRNLFILLSARSQGDRSYLSEVGLTPGDIGLRVSLGGLDADAVRNLLLHHAGTAGATLGQRDGFVDTLCEVSAGDPFYLRFLIEDVEYGRLTPENIGQTPSGLYPYLEEQFNLFCRHADGDLHFEVVGHIVEAPGPLHYSDLLRLVVRRKPDMAGLLASGRLNQVLKDVQRFLLRTGEDWQEYTFCHNRFQDFFRKKIKYDVAS